MALPTLNLERLEQAAITAALEKFHWMLNQASEALGISRWALMRKMKQMGLKHPRRRRTSFP